MEENDEHFVSLLQRAVDAFKQHHLREVREEREKNAVLTKALQDKEEELRKALESNTAQKAELGKLYETTEKQAGRLEKSEDELARLREERVRLQTKLHAKEVELRSQSELVVMKDVALSQLRDELSKVEDHMHVMAYEKANLVDELEDKGVKLEGALSTLQVTQKMNQELRGQLQEKCQTLDKLQREHDSRLMNAVALENTVAERRPAAASTSKDEVTKLKEALRMMTNQNRDLNARLESIEGVVANPSSSSSFKTVQELLAQTAQCQVLLKDYSDREDAIVKDLATKDIKISGLQEKLELSSERDEALMEELSTNEETCSDLKKQLDELKIQTGATLNALSKTSLNDSATAEELAKKFQEIKELKEQCSNLEKLTEWWKGHSTGLQNDLVVLSSKYNRLVDAYHHQTNQYKAELQTISAHTWPGQYGHNASYFHAPDTKGTSKKRWHEIVGLASTDNLIERQVPETGDDGNSRFFKCHRVSYEHLAVKQAPPS